MLSFYCLRVLLKDSGMPDLQGYIKELRTAEYRGN
jgi:hypothetical protein